MTLNYIRWWGSRSGEWGSHPFIAIGSNKSVQKLFVLDRSTWYDITMCTETTQKNVEISI